MRMGLAILKSFAVEYRAICFVKREPINQESKCQNERPDPLFYF